jgi:hypothetical protein
VNLNLKYLKVNFNDVGVVDHAVALVGDRAVQVLQVQAEVAVLKREDADWETNVHAVDLVSVMLTGYFVLIVFWI